MIALTSESWDGLLLGSMCGLANILLESSMLLIGLDFIWMQNEVSSPDLPKPRSTPVTYCFVYTNHSGCCEVTC